MRTLFIGGTKRGYLTLKALLEGGASVVGIISLEQDAHEPERYEQTIVELAIAHGVPLYQTKWMKDRDYGAIISREWQVELAIVVGCRILIPKQLYSLFPDGCLAVHDSLLPEYRGFAPLNWSIINGENHTGVTLFYVAESTDAGDIVGQKRIPIGPDDLAAEVYERVCTATVELVQEMLPRLENRTAPRMPQDQVTGTYTCSRTPADGCIDWHHSTPRIYNLVRALARPYPGAYTFFEGSRVWVWKARPVSDAPLFVGRIPGRVVRRSLSKGTVDVLTGDGVLRLEEVQREGEAACGAATLIKSIRASLGLDLANLLARVCEIEKRLEIPRV